MPEVGKKSLPIRETAHKRIKRISADQGRSILEVIDDMVLQYECAISIKRSGSTNDVTSTAEMSDVLQSALSGLQEHPLTPHELVSIRRLLFVLRSQKPGLADAIGHNLIQFVDVAVLYARHGSPDRAAESGAGPEGRVRDADERIAALERDSRQSGARADALARELRGIASAGAGERSSKAPLPIAVGGGRKAPLKKK
jgi:hypothetical protein